MGIIYIFNLFQMFEKGSLQIQWELEGSARLTKVLFVKSWEIIDHGCMLGRSISSRKGEHDNVEETLNAEVGLTGARKGSLYS